MVWLKLIDSFTHGGQLRPKGAGLDRKDADSLPVGGLGGGNDASPFLYYSLVCGLSAETNQIQIQIFHIRTQL